MIIENVFRNRKKDNRAVRPITELDQVMIHYLCSLSFKLPEQGKPRNESIQFSKDNLLVWYSLLNVVQKHSKPELNRYVKQTSPKSFNSISTLIYRVSKVGYSIPTWVGIGTFLLISHTEWYLLVDLLINKPFLHLPRYSNILGEITLTEKPRVSLEATNLSKRLTTLERLTLTMKDTVEERLSVTTSSNQRIEKYKDSVHHEEPRWLVNLIHDQAYSAKQPCIEDSYGQTNTLQLPNTTPKLREDRLSFLFKEDHYVYTAPSIFENEYYMPSDVSKKDGLFMYDERITYYKRWLEIFKNPNIFTIDNLSTIVSKMQEDRDPRNNNVVQEGYANLGEIVQRARVEGPGFLRSENFLRDNPRCVLIPNNPNIDFNDFNNQWMITCFNEEYEEFLSNYQET